MKLPRLRLVLMLLFGLVHATPSLAQYMYLDTNGDGIHTAADQVNAVGTTLIDIWLDTDSNRDGSAAACVNGSIEGRDPNSIVSYSFVLRAVGGTVAWGNFTNAVGGFGIHFLSRKTDTDLGDGYGGTTLPAGLYRLGQVQTTPISGAPSIQIVPAAPPIETQFGSACLGSNFDNTLRLGSDWFDADGLPFGTGGAQNGAPALAQPQDMSVAVGELASQPLTATDPDRQSLTFSTISGPEFVRVSTLDPGRGSANGIVHLAPRAAHVGTATIVVGVSDGILSDQRDFGVTVTSAQHPPVLAAPQRIDVVAGAICRVQIQALDPDGQGLTFAKTYGPEYAEIAALSSGPATTAGSLRLAPQLCDVGSATAVISATDGHATASVELMIRVLPAIKAPPSPPSYGANQYLPVVAIADVNSDGHLDVLTATDRPTTILTFLGKGDGTLQEGAHTPAGNGEPTGMVVGDFNKDGHPDVAITRFPGSTVGVFLGRGDGTFLDGQEFGSLADPFGVTAADMNRDGALDLLVANGGGAAVSLFLGAGDGTFAPKRDIDFGGAQREVAVADFNRDGFPDIAASCFGTGLGGRTVGVRLGFGDGTFDDAKALPFGGGAPYAIIAGDWNWDGLMDLTVSDYGKGRVVMFLGDGAGGFAPSVELGGFHTPQSLASADFNVDGVPDLLVGDLSNEIVTGESPTRIAYGAGDGTFGTPRALTALPMWDVASGDLNEDGFPDAVTAGYGLNVWLNDAAGAGTAQTRAFSRLDSHRSFPFIAALAPECVRMEPVAGSFQNSDVNYRSIVLSSEGTGSVSEIPAIFEYRPPQRDFDRNGVTEIPVCFDRRDLNRLFDKLRGRQSVTAHLEGALTDGRRFCTPVELDISGGRRRFAVFLTPNPLNPQATLTYSTTADGFVKIRVFDLNGRLVRTLVDQPMVPAGDHAVVIDGRNQSGARLASGIYFYQVEAQEGTVQGRMTILK